MSRQVKLVITCSVLALLSACIGMEPRSVTHLRPEGDPFQKALHAEYAELAVKESALYDWGAATRFAHKARAAADGQPVAPETPAIWGIEPGRLGELNTAHQRLVTILETTPARVSAPASAAAAQASLDCWVEEQHEGHQPRAIAECWQRWEAAMAEIQTALHPDVVPAAAPAMEGEALLDREWEVFFPINSAGLSQEAEAVVDQVVSTAQLTVPQRITIAGHTDRSGPAEYNEHLSRARAEAVAAQLIKLGVAPHLIHIAAHGEQLPAVPTADGRAHQMNRRVVMHLL